MTTVTAVFVPRKPARPQETRVAPRPHIRLEYPGLSCPIDRRPLPTIEGVGLEADELRRVDRARTEAEEDFARDSDPSVADLAASVGRAKAREELVRVLRERTEVRAVTMPRRDAGDEAFWAAMNWGFEVVPLKRLVEQKRKDWDEVGTVESGLCVGNLG